jgi:hypothetical protein
MSGYFSGREHAGENLAKVLKQRAKPILISEFSDFPLLLSHGHARTNWDYLHADGYDGFLWLKRTHEERIL